MFNGPKIASALLAALVFATDGLGQFGGMGGGMGLGGGGGGLGGVFLDAQGVVRVGKNPAKSNSKSKSAVPKLPAELARRSELRQVSLRGLDREIRSALKSQEESLPEVLHQMAGLHRIDFILIDRERKDVVLCGPAEGWIRDSDGRCLGSSSQRPVLDVFDMANLLRVFRSGTGEIRISIDPEENRLADVMSYKVKEAITGSKTQAEGIRDDIADRLGLQNVRTEGIPKGSRIARALVDADYRMKRMAMGIERVRGLTAHVDVATENAIKGRSTDGYARWWFTMAYDGVSTNAERTVFRLEGPGMKLLYEKDFVAQDGTRKGSGNISDSGDRFSKSFNKMLPRLEEKYPVFADLHNIFDLSMVAAMLKQEGILDWLSDTVFLDNTLLKIPVAAHPTQAEPVVAYKLAKVNSPGRSGHFVGIAAGGISISPGQSLGKPGFIQVGGSASQGTGVKRGSASEGGATGSSTGDSTKAGFMPTIHAPASQITSDRWWADVKQP